MLLFTWPRWKGNAFDFKTWRRSKRCSPRTSLNTARSCFCSTRSRMLLFFFVYHYTIRILILYLKVTLTDAELAERVLFMREETGVHCNIGTYIGYEESKASFQPRVLDAI